MEEKYSINEKDDSDDEDGGDPGRRMSGDERELKQRTHNLSIFDPPPSMLDVLASVPPVSGSHGACVYAAPKRFTLLRGKILKSIETLYTYWLRLRNDRYQWALFKTILWFAIGLKLFHDLARHAKVSLLLGGGQSKCPRINESRRRDACAKPPQIDACAKAPKIDPCAKPPQKDPCPKPPQIDPCAKPVQIDPCSKLPQIDPCAKPPQIDPCAKAPQIDPCACPQSDESPQTQTPQSEEDKKIAEQCRNRWLY